MSDFSIDVTPSALAALSSARQLDQAALMARIQNGDVDALEALFRSVGSLLYKMAFRLLGQREDAEEIVCDVFVRVWRQATTYDPRRGSVAAWCAVMARSMAIDRLRSGKFAAESQRIDIDALAARYNDPAFWSRALIEPADDPLA